MTIPRAEPSTQLVEKKAMFLASSTSALESSASRLCGSDSPVSDELSTFIELAWMTRISGDLVTAFNLDDITQADLTGDNGLLLAV